MKIAPIFPILLTPYLTLFRLLELEVRSLMTNALPINAVVCVAKMMGRNGMCMTSSVFCFGR